jgi:hypothetical protein
MHRYVVASAETPSRSIALCDAYGQFHLARATAATPQVGTKLTGNTPALGFGLLLGESLDKVYRVTFEAVNCSREQALPSKRNACGPMSSTVNRLDTTAAVLA